MSRKKLKGLKPATINHQYRLCGHTGQVEALTDGNGNYYIVGGVPKKCPACKAKKK